MKNIAGVLFLALSIPAHAAITGSVVDDDGAPIAGAVVRVFTYESPVALAQRIAAGKLERDPIARVATTDTGAFKIETNGTPVVTLTASAPGRQVVEMFAADGDETGPLMIATAAPRKIKITSDGKPVANAIVIVGTSATKSGADGMADVPDVAGSNTGITVVHPDYAPSLSQLNSATKEVKLTTGGVVRGRVVAQDGRTAVPHARVAIGNWSSSETADDGSFTIAHVPQHWTFLRATAADGAVLGVVSNSASTTNYKLQLRPFAAVSGTIRDSKTRAAVAGVPLLLTLRGEGAVSDAVTTDAKGAFKFDRVPQGQYAVVALHPAYQVEQTNIDTADREPRVLNATPLARVRGVVVDEEKKPVRGAIVSRAALAQFEAMRSAVTNARGEFSLRIAAFASPAMVDNNLLALKTGHAGGGATAKVIAGDTTTGVTIVLTRGVPVAFSVVDREKKPVEQASIVLTPWRNDPFARGGSMTNRGMTDASGTLKTRVAPGKFDIGVSGEGIVPKTLNAQAIDAKSSALTIVVERGVEISGRVVTSDGNGVADATVALQPSGSGMQMATSDATGAFTFRNAPRGNATLQATLQRGSRVTSGKKEVSAPATSVVITMPRGGAISGRVIDEATHSPVTSFQIAAGNRTARAMPAPFQADDGAFTVGDLAAGSTDLEVSAKGYAPAIVHGIEVEEGKTTSDVEVHLERGAVLKGRVTSSTGQPIEAASITLDRDFTRGAVGPPIQPNRDVTDANGNYSIDSVAPGTRRVTISKSGYIPAVKSVEAVSGKEVTLDVSLDRGRELHGRVIDESGEGVALADVRPETQNTPAVRTEADGSFTLSGLRDAHLRVVARKNGYVEARAEDVDPGGPPITLTLKRGGTITGRVSGVSEAELAIVVVNATGPSGNTSGRVDGAGNFTISGVSDGRFAIDAWLTTGEGRHTPRKTIDVMNGSAPPVDLSFAEGATIRGRVTVHGQPLAGAVIAFTPAGSTMYGGGASAHVESDGSYVATNVPTGEATAFVSSSQYGAVSSEKVMVTNNMNYDVDVRASVVRGHVVDAQTSAPIPDAQIVFQPAEAGAPSIGARGTTTDFNGRFTSDLVPERKWRLRVQREKYETGYAEIDVAPGMPEVEVRLTAGTPTTVRVVDARDGSPVMNAYVVATAASNRPVFGGQTKDDGTMQLWLTPGKYTVRANAQQYVAATASIDVPGPTVQIALDHAGRIVVTSPANARLRLSGGGLQSPIMSFNGRFETLRPGAYTLELLTSENKVLQQKQVVVTAGETTTVTF